MNTHADSKHSQHHISPVSLYVAIWVGLMILTIITVAVAQLDFGPLNTVVAMTVATIKASLVVLYFMHLKYDKPFHSVAFAIGIVFFGLFLGLMLLDVGARRDPIPTKDFAPIEKPDPLKGKTPHGHISASEGEHKDAAGAEKKEAPGAEKKDAPAAEKAGEKPTEKAAEKTGGKAAEKATPKAAEKK